jgi:hypothetical protein
MSEPHRDSPSPALLRLLQPGARLRVWYRHPDSNAETYHIRAIVDNNFVVSRIWSKHRNGWDYRVDHWYFFELTLKDGGLRKVGSDPVP